MKNYLHILFANEAISLVACASRRKDSLSDKAIYGRLPFEMEEVQLPSSPCYKKSGSNS